MPIDAIAGEALAMKILLVDDHVLVREALRGVVAELQPNAAVLEAATCAGAFSLLQQHADLGLVLLDLNLPDRNGLDALEDLRDRYPATAVVMLSGANDRESVAAALAKGALGFIPKSASREVLVSAIRLVLAGGIYIPPEILMDVEHPTAPAPSPGGRSAAELGLTPRQVEVLALMMQGKSNKLICRTLQLAEPTVKNHVSAILKALGAANRTEAALAAAKLNWDLPKATG
jgi:DNA-binding NarL/FixJ family response regulator